MRLAALSLRDDWGLSVQAVAEELGTTRNAPLGWFARIDADDAAAHGMPLRPGRPQDRRLLRASRVSEREAALAELAPC